MPCYDIGQNFQELHKLCRIAIGREFGSALIRRALPLQHISSQGPRGAGKADHGFVRRQRRPRLTHSVINGGKFLCPNNFVAYQTIRPRKRSKNRTNTLLEPDSLANAKGTTRISEKRIAASKSNRLIGCNVTSTA